MSKTLTHALSVIVPLVCVGCGWSKPEWIVTRSADLSSKIDSLFAPYEVPYSPGGIAAVLFEGELVHLKGYGSANREFNVAWTPDIRYRIASITKGFTGHATILLAERGMLDLDDPVQQHLSDFPTFETPVRIRHLLTMTSGIWYDEWLLPLAGITGHATLDEMYSLVTRQDRLNYTPGTAYNYIDSNSRIMARIIEAVTGLSWQDALRDLIFGPLEMDATSAPPDIAQVFDEQGTTYLSLGGDVTPLRFEFPFETSGDGSLLTTFADFIRWLEHVREGFEEGTSIFDRLKGPTRLADGSELSYGYGVGEVRYRGLRGWGHGGATGTQWVFFPELDLTVATFTNYLGEISAAAKLREIIDAFLASDLNPDPSILGDSNPLHDEVSSRASGLSEEDREALRGTFVDPTTGYSLRSVGRDASFALDFLGAVAPLEKTGECAYQAVNSVSVPPIRVEIVDCGSDASGSVMVRWGDWPSARRFIRARQDEPPRHPRADYVGHYFSEQLDVYWRVELEGDGLELRIGAGVQSGQVFDLEQLLPDIFVAEPHPPTTIDLLALSPLAVRFQRGAGGRVTFMHVATERVRGLRFQRR